MAVTHQPEATTATDGAASPGQDPDVPVPTPESTTPEAPTPTWPQQDEGAASSSLDWYAL